MIKLKTRIIMLFTIFSLGLIFLVNIISNILIKNLFNDYIKEKISQRKVSILEDISASYNNGKWDIRDIDKIGLTALNNGLIIKVTDDMNNAIWDANKTYSMMCESMLSEMSTNMVMVNPNVREEYIEESYIVKKENLNIGNVYIGYYGPIYYNSSDIMFFKALNAALIIVTIIAIILSIIIGMIVSANISKPILNIVKSTKEIANGNYADKLICKNNIKELNEMTKSINELSDSLQKDDKMRKMLTRDISHELRTPLTTIQLQIEALIDGVWEPTEKRLIGIQGEILRLTRLVMSLEELSQYDNDYLKLKKEKIEISQLIKILLINFEKQAFDKNIKVEENFKEVYLEIDKDKISQCIINLISNAMKYTEAGGIINISCFSDKNYGYISIKDNGIGIDKKHIKNIFKRFYRVDTSRSRKTGGVGVGLTISRSIIEAHGGYISVNSNPGCGSDFIISIPLK